MKRAAVLVFAVCALGAAFLPIGVAHASPEDEAFARGVAALEGGKPEAAIREFEGLADLGIVDPVVSYNRGLSYALRAKLGAVPGDLGRAAHGFQEARALASSVDPSLTVDATVALETVRSQVARARARAGASVELDKGLPLGRSIVRLLNEDQWAMAALAFSVLFGLAMFAHWRVRERHGRIASIVVASLSGPAWVVFAVLSVFARHERTSVQEGVVVSSSARLANEKGVPVPEAESLPEAAHVEVLETRAGYTHVRWGNVVGWIPAAAVRPIHRSLP
jgi:hypothetical protein